MKKLLLLGASGSIGTQTIDIINEHPDDLKLMGVSVGKNTDTLKDILSKFNLDYVYSIDRCKDLETKYPSTRFYYGDNGLEEIVKEDSYDTLVNALVGFVGFKPTLIAIENKKDIALANKETLVAGGDIVNEYLKKYKVNLYPIDSEHSAIAQCLAGSNRDDIKRLIITASGGAFRDLKRDQLKNVTKEDALKHPCWSMGKKITIDSASMVNKCFEVIEAHHLFNIPFENIDVYLHREVIVHSMVEYKDGSIIAQLGTANMRLPIKYALLAPRHLGDKVSDNLTVDMMSKLTFEEIDTNRYPLVKYTKEVVKNKGNLGAIFIGANDTLVDKFLHDLVSFEDIEKGILDAFENAKYIKNPTVDEIIESNNWAKKFIEDKYK